MLQSLAEAEAQARQFLPAGLAASLFLGYLLAAALVAWLGSKLGAWIALRNFKGHEQAFWIERARRAYPARAVSATNVLLFPAVIAGLTLLCGWPFAPGIRRLLCVVSFLVAWLVAGTTALHVERAVREGDLSSRYWWQSMAVLNLCYRPHGVMVLLLLYLLPAEFDTTTTWVAWIAAGPYVFFTLGGGLLLARGLGLARPASVRLSRIVDRSSQSVGVAPKAVYELRWCVANALAFPPIGCLAFTDHALATTSDDDLEVICAHELAHLTESWWIRLSRVSALLLLFPLAFARPIIGTYGVNGLAITALACWVLIILVRRLARAMEQRADRIAQDHESAPGRYAHALERLYQSNLMPVVMPHRRTIHPSLYDRISDAGAAPDYARPAPPSRMATVAGLSASVVLLLACSLGWIVGPRLMIAALGPQEALLYWAAAARLGDSSDAAVLSNLAQYRLERDDYAAAAAFGRAAWATDPMEFRHAANLAFTLSANEQYEEANQVLERAQQQALQHPGLPGAELLHRARQAVDRARGH